MIEENSIVLVDGVKEPLHPTATMNIQSMAAAIGLSPEHIKKMSVTLRFKDSTMDPRYEDFLNGKTVRMLSREAEIFPEWIQ